MSNKSCCLSVRTSSTTKIKKLAFENFSYFHSNRANFSSMVPNMVLISYPLTGILFRLLFLYVFSLPDKKLSASPSDANQENVILGYLPCPLSSVEARRLKGRTRGRCVGKSEVIPSPSYHKVLFSYNKTHMLDGDVSCAPSCSWPGRVPPLISSSLLSCWSWTACGWRVGFLEGCTCKPSSERSWRLKDGSSPVTSAHS